MNYEVRLKIKNRTQGGRYEFVWDGQTMRTTNQTTSLLIEADSDNALIDKVIDLSNNTLEILSFEEEAKDTDTFISTMIDYVTQILSPMEIINIVQTGPATISNN